MKTFITAILLASTNLALAQGGLTIDNVAQHANTSNWVNTEAARSEIVVQGPVDQFQVVTQGNEQNIVDTNELMQSYSGQS